MHHTSIEYRKQHIGRDDCPSHAHTRQTRTLPLDSSSGCHTRAYRLPLRKRDRRRDYLWQSVHAQDTHTLLCVHYNLDSGEGIHKQLVQREGRTNLAGYAPWALAPDVGEEHENRDRYGTSWTNRTLIYVKKNLSPCELLTNLGHKEAWRIFDAFFTHRIHLVQCAGR